MKNTLATRIRLFVAVMCLGFGLAVLGVFQVLSEQQVRQRASRDAVSGAEMLRTILHYRNDSFRTNTAQLLRFGPIAYLADADAATIRAAEKAGRFEGVGADAVVFTGLDGKIVGGTGRYSAVQDLRRNAGVRSALDQRNWFGIVVHGGKLTVQVSVPALVGDHLKGTVTGFWEIDERVAREMHRVFPYDMAFAQGGRIGGGSIPVAGLPVTSRGEPWTVVVNGTSYLAKYAPFPDAEPKIDAGLVVFRPTAELLAPRRQFSVAFISALSFVCLVALVGGTLFSRTISRSLEGIVRAARKLQAGEWPDKFVVRRTDEIGLVESTFNEMSESLRRSQERLLAMLDVDPLTELDNHRRFKESLPTEVVRTVERGEPLTLMLLDIDRFAEYNREHGHAEGDQKLKEVAAALRGARPAYAGLARYGGEEFAVLLPGHTYEDARELFDRVRTAVTGVTISGGCAELTSARGKAEGLVMAAELSLERAKQLGRNRLCDFGAVPGAEGDDPMELYRYLHDGTYATVKALAAAVDAKDPYTHGHSDRVAGYAADLAAYVGADPLEVDLVHRTGTLHDVGKIGVPDAILQKPGRLDPEELRAMQSHSVLGEFIVAKVPQLAEMLPGVRHHHERYDGKGYPDGLTGSAIPRIARFLAVADTYDAMTSDRPYRPGLPIDVALAEIEKNAGTQFDPEFARAFAEMMRKRMKVGA